MSHCFIKSLFQCCLVEKQEQEENLQSSWGIVLEAILSPTAVVVIIVKCIIYVCCNNKVTCGGMLTGYYYDIHTH